MVTTQEADKERGPQGKGPGNRLRFIRVRLIRLALGEWQVWMAVAGIAGSWAVAYTVAQTLQQQITYSGTILQVLGLGTVAVGLRKSRRLFKRPGFFSRLAEVFAKPRTANLSGDSPGLSLDVASPWIKNTLPSDATTEQRLAALEHRLDQIETFARAQEKKRTEEIADLQKNLESEATERDRETSGLRELIETAVIGGLRLEQAGLVWIAVGVVMGTAPEFIEWITHPARVLLGWH